MRITFPLLSALSSGVLLAAMLLGGQVSLYDVTISATLSEDVLSVSIHPAWLVWINTRDLFRGACYGNVMICDDTLPPLSPNERHREVIVAHEAQHLKQWRALGFGVWIAQYILPLEPALVDWSDPELTVSTMWNPPEDWPRYWDFITFEIPWED